MRTAADIYNEYRIMPGLRMHQLRMAALARAVAVAAAPEADLHAVTLAGLFHDMGNIIKSDLGHFPEFLKPEGKDYWEEVKREYIEKYGRDEERATLAIAREIELPPAVVELLAQMGFSRVSEIRDEGPLELQLIEYADQRVGPHGVLSLDERLAEGRVRYQSRHGYSYNDDQFNERAQALRDIENRLFEGSDTSPDAFTEERIAADRDALREFPVS